MLLVPWTLALALTPAQHWFGSAWVKWAWVSFDGLLLLGLFRELTRPSPKLLTALALLVSADAVLTLAEALLWNIARAHGWFELTVISVACSMPALAAAALWGARRRSQRTARAAPQLESGAVQG